ncbi:hypothetical protein Tco_0183699 [Tanacetum coccineum]
MDDEPMWAAGRVVALTPSSAITIPKTANEFAIKGMSNYGKFLKELVSNKHKLEQILVAFLSNESSALIQNKVPPKFGDPGSFLIPCNFNKAFSCDALANLGASINLSAIFVILEMEEDIGIERMTFHMDSAMKHSYSNDDTCFSIVAINDILKEDFDALLVKGSKILYSIEGTILKEKLFAEFDEFMAMTADENFKSESDIEEPPLKKITFNTDYKIKTSREESPTDIELKPLPGNLEYVFLEEPSFLPVIISSQGTNITLQGLSYDVYSLVSHHRVAKDLWERVQLLMQGQYQALKQSSTLMEDKVLLVKAQGSGKVLNEEELEFLADSRVVEVLMANLYSYGSDVLSEVPHSENTHNDMLNQSVQEMPYYEQTHLVNYLENEKTSDSNIIPYSQYMLETQNAAV